MGARRQGANGYLTARRKSFWKYSDGTLPAIADVLTSGNRLYVVLTLEVLKNYRTSSVTYEWQTADWTFAFADFSTPPVAATSFGITKDPNVFKILAFSAFPLFLFSRSSLSILFLQFCLYPRRAKNAEKAKNR